MPASTSPRPVPRLHNRCQQRLDEHCSGRNCRWWTCSRCGITTDGSNEIPTRRPTEDA